MANYFPQADPSGACCDCPDRESPCDSCDTGCHCAARITVSDIVMPCCVPVGPASASITEVGLNGAIIEGKLQAGWACDPSQCFWFDQLGGDNVLTTHKFSALGCVTEVHTSPEFVDGVVGFVGGIYYVVIFSDAPPFGGPDTPTLFYGEAASLAAPIPNLLTSCSAGPNDYHVDNAFTDCWNGGPLDATVFGYDGTVDVELISTCGVCCFDGGVCDYPSTEKICNKRHGTYHADDHTCDPNPCP